MISIYFSSLCSLYTIDQLNNKGPFKLISAGYNLVEHFPNSWQSNSDFTVKYIINVNKEFQPSTISITSGYVLVMNAYKVYIVTEKSQQNRWKWVSMVPTKYDGWWVSSNNLTCRIGRKLWISCENINIETNCI